MPGNGHRLSWIANQQPINGGYVGSDYATPVLTIAGKLGLARVLVYEPAHHLSGKNISVLVSSFTFHVLTTFQDLIVEQPDFSGEANVCRIPHKAFQ
jgi:hypothetical protein